MDDFRSHVLPPQDEENGLEREVNVLYTLLSDIIGADRLVVRAAKLNALELMESSGLPERVLALQRIIMQNPTLDHFPLEIEIPGVLAELKDELADLLMRRSVEEQLERMINDRMQERQDEYVKEIKMQLLREQGGPENPQTLKKLAELEKMEHVSLARSAMEMLRPMQMSDIVGQEAPIRALLAKIACPMPQHVILYGPPGVGKTSAARLVMEAAKKLSNNPFAADAPFVEVDGNTLRWDPRDITNPLIGSVHDPIYQGAKRDFADTGIPEPKLGLVSEAHGGVLFIDEIGEMDPMLLNKLLKVLEDKRVRFESSYYDPQDPNVPQYVKQMFSQGAPADFILIGATTRSPWEINPAIRSRCGEIFFDPLTPAHIEEIVRRSAKRLKVTLDKEVPAIVSRFTIEGRKANSLIADAYGIALLRRQQEEAENPPQPGKRRRPLRVKKADLYEVIQSSRLVPYVLPRDGEGWERGRAYGLGVAGFVGSLLEIEALAHETEEGKGRVRFNETAGSMAKDSVFNAAAVFAELTGKELVNYDIHVNVVGGGNIDGPSAGLAFLLAIYSAVSGRRIRQDLAMTGEISIQGKVRPVGGIPEKIYGARQAGMRMVLLPKANEADIPAGELGIEVRTVASVAEAIKFAMEEERKQ